MAAGVDQAGMDHGVANLSAGALHGLDQRQAHIAETQAKDAGGLFDR